MKKYLLISLALLLGLALAVSCAPKGKPADLGAAEITVQVESSWMELYEAAAKRITDANPEVTIKLMEIGSFDHLGILDETDASNPDVADVFALPADRLTGLAGKDLLGSSVAKKIADGLGGWSDFDGGLGGLFKLDGEYLAFPYNIETLVVFANTKNAEAQGLELDQPVELEGIGDPATILLPVFDAWFGVALTNSADIALLKEEGDGFVSDLTTDWGELEGGKKAALTVLYDYWKLNHEGNTTLFDADAGWGYIDEKFTSGQAARDMLAGKLSEKDQDKLVDEYLTKVVFN